MMGVLARLWVCTAAMLLALGCATPEPTIPTPPPPPPATPEPAPKTPSGPVIFGKEPPPQLLPDCPVKDVVCAQLIAPVMCTATTHDGRPLDPKTAPVVWGANACMGRMKLAKEACMQNLSPPKLGQIRCVPDPSNGRCPPVAIPCASGGQPVACVARAYGDQKLSPQQQLTASGLDQCQASTNLMLLACRQSLDPAMLRDISCKGEPKSAVHK